LSLATSLTSLLIGISSLPRASFADVMMFHTDGSASASGWAFHGVRPDNIELIGYSRETSRENPQPIQSQRLSNSSRESILNAVRDTAARHEGEYRKVWGSCWSWALVAMSDHGCAW
jgi:hypothetical protein